MRRATALLLALALTGCGQTGALYLPDEGTSTPVEIRPIGGGATPAPAPAATAPGEAAAPRQPDDEKKPAGPAAAPAPTATP